MKRKWSTFIGILMIVIGIGVFCFPIINEAIAKQESDLLLDAARESILMAMKEEKRENEELESSSGSSFEETMAADLTPIPTSSANGFLNIALEQLDLPQQAEEHVLESDRLRGQKLAGIIEIEAIDLIYAIVDGTQKYNIGVAIGRFEHSAAIGAEGNCALAGHRGGYSGSYFKDIDKLVEGDEIKVMDMNGDEFVYLVTESFVVEPTATYVVDDLKETGRFLTLVSCTDSGTKRLIVRAAIYE